MGSFWSAAQIYPFLFLSISFSSLIHSTFIVDACSMHFQKYQHCCHIWLKEHYSPLLAFLYRARSRLYGKFVDLFLSFFAWISLFEQLMTISSYSLSFNTLHTFGSFREWIDKFYFILDTYKWAFANENKVYLCGAIWWMLSLSVCSAILIALWSVCCVLYKALRPQNNCTHMWAYCEINIYCRAKERRV